jgi:hypothetical protein
VLGLDPAVIAEQLGHKDGGRLVEELYGHPDKRIRRSRLREAFALETRTTRSVPRDGTASQFTDAGLQLTFRCHGL